MHSFIEITELKQSSSMKKLKKMTFTHIFYRWWMWNCRTGTTIWHKFIQDVHMDYEWLLINCICYNYTCYFRQPLHTISFPLLWIIQAKFRHTENLWYCKCIQIFQPIQTVLSEELMHLLPDKNETSKTKKNHAQ